MADAEKNGLERQFEAGLLSLGREHLQRFCESWRYRNLYPSGENIAVLLRAYQALDVERTVASTPWTHDQTRARFLKLLQQMVRQDALRRQLRVRYGLPTPRAQKLENDPPTCVERAIARLDPEVRESVRFLVQGRHERLASGQTRLSAVFYRISSGMEEFKQHLANEALASPFEIPSLHPQYLRYCDAPLPRTLGHPLVGFLFVRLPLGAILLLASLFFSLYFSAYAYLNFERLNNGELLADLLTERLSARIDGRLEFEHVRFGPTLLFDTLAGTAHQLEVDGVSVFEPSLSGDEVAPHKTAYAEKLVVSLNVQEIIPFNWLRLPRLLHFPWKLHFTDVESTGEFWLEAREIPGDATGTVGLVAAFQVDPTSSIIPPWAKTLGIEIDHIVIANPEIKLLFEEVSTWAIELTATSLAGDMYYEGHVSSEPTPALLPLRWNVNAQGVHGEVRALGYRIPLDDVTIHRLADGAVSTPLGDMSIEATGNFAGGPSTLSGVLRALSDRATPVTANATLSSKDLGPLVAWFLHDVLNAAPGARPMFSGENARGRVKVVGPLDDPVLTLEAEGLGADLFEESEWSVEDIGVRLDLSKAPVPSNWSATWGEVTGDTTLPERWLVQFDVLRGESLGGSLSLQGTGADDHVVLPSSDQDPLLASLDFDVSDIDPGKVFMESPTLETTLTGTASGRLKVRELVLKPTENEGLAFSRTRIKLDGLQVMRDRGPRDDGLPRDFNIDGEVTYEDPGGLQVKNLAIGLRGASITGAVGLESDWNTFKPSSLNLDINEGALFFGSLGLPTYVSALRWEMLFRGPMNRLQGAEREMRFESLKLGNLELSDAITGSATFRQGLFLFRAKNVDILGGRGPLSIDANFFDRDGVADDPTLKLVAELDGIDRQDLLGTGVDVAGATLSLKIDDGNEGRVSFSDLQARGFASAKSLTTKAATFRDANLGFMFLEDGLQIDTLSLEYHPSLSPYLGGDGALLDTDAGGGRVPYGRIEGIGKISVALAKPSVDLYLRASRIPLSSLADIAFPELKLRGNLSTRSQNSVRSTNSLNQASCVNTGDCLHVAGNIDSPLVEGTLYLNGFSALDLPLGSGHLNIEPAAPSGDSLPPGGKLTPAASHGLHLTAEFEGAVTRDLPEDPPISWTTSAVVAFGSKKNKTTPVDAYIEAFAPRIPISTILSGVANKKYRDAVAAELGGARVQTSYCGSSTALIDSCRPHQASGLLPSDISIDYAWAHPRLRETSARPAGEQRASGPTASRVHCSSELSLCSTNTLRAELDGDRFTFLEPWFLRSGDTAPEELKIDGSFDLRTPPPQTGAECSDRLASKISAGSKAHISGRLSLAGLTAELAPYGLLDPKGILELRLTLTGPVTSPQIFGAAQLDRDAPIQLSVDLPLLLGDDGVVDEALRRPPLPIDVEKLSFQFAGNEGQSSLGVTMFDERLSIDADFSVLSQCTRSFDLRANGHIAGQTISTMVPELVESGSGRVAVNNLQITGALDDEAGVPLDSIDGDLRFEPAAPLVVSTPIDTVRITDGTVFLDSCVSGSAGKCTTRGEELSTISSERARGVLPVLSVGGLGTSGTDIAPPNAVVMRVGNQGSVALWGDLILSSTLDGLSGVTLSASLDRVPVTSTDNSGVPEFELSLSSSNLTARMDGFNSLSLSGELFLDRSRWLRDANLRASLISFEDPTPAPPDQLPEFLRRMNLDLKVRTNAPFRTDINVLKGVEARGEINVGGTVTEPLLSGEVTLDRGEVNIPILGEPYRIEQGTVRVEDDLSLSEVNLTAVGLEPKKIDNQLKTVSLLVRGPLNAITWECLTAGNTSGQLTTTRGCLDFVVFDAGNPELARADVRRAGGGSLVYARPLTLVGNLTQITVNDLIDDDAPIWESRLPIVRARVTQLGLEAKIDTRPEWFDLGWGQLSFGLNYLQGFPGGLLRNSRRLYGRFDLFGNTNVEFRAGRRNYSQRVLILDPSSYSALELGQTWEIPSLR